MFLAKLGEFLLSPLYLAHSWSKHPKWQQTSSVVTVDMHSARSSCGYPTQSDVCTCVQSTCYYPLVVDYCQCLHIDLFSSNPSSKDTKCRPGAEKGRSASHVASDSEHSKVIIPTAGDDCSSHVLVSRMETSRIGSVISSFSSSTSPLLFDMFDTTADGWSETLMVFACVNEWIINLENVHNHHEDDPSKTLNDIAWNKALPSAIDTTQSK